MKRYQLLLLFAALISGALALTAGEESVLQTFRTSWPALSFIQPVWTENISEACGPRPFYGLTCSEGPDPHVTKIEFADISQGGPLPPSINELSWLTVLSIKHGCVWAALPDGLERMSNLTVLELEVDDFCKEREDTTMLKDVGNLTRLENLTLALGRLTGSLPANIGSLASLRHLTIRTPLCAYSRLTGEIPSSFSRLFQTLETLRLECTGLGRAQPPSSTVPNSSPLKLVSFASSRTLQAETYMFYIRQSRALRHIDFSWTGMSLTLFDFNLPNLEYLNLEGSLINWSDFPNNFWNYLPNAQFVSLADTAIQGSIGETIRYAHSLRYLDLSRTLLTGAIPHGIGLCPLEHLILKSTRLSHPLPLELARLNATLQSLKITHLSGEGPLLHNLTAFTRLEEIELSSSGFIGTLPAGLALATNLSTITIDNNALEGPFPDLRGDKRLTIDAHNNRLNGTIPRSLASRVNALDLSHNYFESGDDDRDLFLHNDLLQGLDLSHNHLSSDLPLLSAEYLDLSFNNFSGEVPLSYCNSTSLNLAHNDLSGSLEGLLSPDCSKAKELNINGNNFVKLPDISKLSKLFSLNAANNYFTGGLPLLNESLRLLDASYNHFDGSNMQDFARCVRLGQLESLDLSGNGIVTNEPFWDLIGPKMKYLLLSTNKFVNTDSHQSSSSNFGSLIGLDLSNNNISGTFTSSLFRDLAMLKLSDNQFSGDFDLRSLPSLTHIDISNNNFSFDVTFFKSMPLLMRINARNNLLFGSLELDESLPNLAIADFSGNRLNQAPNLAPIGALFGAASLEMLNISNNPLMPNFSSLHASNTILQKTSTSAPSVYYPLIATCYQLAFLDQTAKSFIFDEGLFSYAQCECNQKYFGKPPHLCLKCPSTDGDCGGPKLDVPSGMFAYLALRDSTDDQQKRSTELTDFISLAWTSMKASLGLERLQPIALEASSQYMSLEMENCRFTSVQLISGISNCNGFRFSANNFTEMPDPKLLDRQCKEGTSGRLCARCKCNPSSTAEDCWYSSNAGCTKCRFVFKPSTSIPLLTALLVILFALCTALMTVAIRSRRTQRITPYASLPLARRIFYRLYKLFSLGNLSILISFVQIFIAITQWDANWKAEILGLLNGDVGGIGLPCLFPFLSAPIWALLLQLSIPYLGIIFIALATAVSAAVAKCLSARASKPQLATINDSDGEELALLDDKADYIIVNYPAKALTVSLSISFIKFFYFGTALAAHNNLFAEKQPYTGVSYMQNTPWLETNASQSWSLVAASVPSILIFDFGIPLAFFILCMRVRHRLQTNSVRIYFGNLFDAYNPRCFWWEIVNIMKKLSIALVLRGFAWAAAIQNSLILSILVGTVLIQVHLNPWRRKIENFMDTASGLLLVGALFIVQSQGAQQIHSGGVAWIFLWIVVVYMFVSAGIIIWRTFTDKTDYEKQIEQLAEIEEIEEEEEHPLTESDSSMATSL